MSVTKDCTPDHCSQQAVPMIFRWHSPEHCPAAPTTTEPAKPSQHEQR